ncbi:PREDICTED: 14.7 kDa ribonuclease H-like protein [Theobroma cacao]|uniref:14.7 kDa ribonuclease H-like protein n=1 Tax=Theobroma cacao TaxID=3641 RepID=A0AB32W990_THECC|nr:PREDICTED: 14.7 kDa ribonuclease H-like protein [Theobroma cacao]
MGLPHQGQMKFNVDGAARGCPGPAGIGGILTNHKGDVRVIFSKSIGVADSNLAELLAIKEAFIIFTSSRWRNDQKLVIECDSSNAVKWINQSHTAPWRMRKWLIQIERMKEKLMGWDVKHVRREANQRADSLANEGVQLQNDILRVYGNDTGDPAQENLDL